MFNPLPDSKVLDVWGDATIRLDGTVLHGSEWQIAIAGERVWLGMPDQGQVLALQPPFEEALATPELVLSGQGQFGAQVAVVNNLLWVSDPSWDNNRGALFAFEDPQQSTDTSQALIRLEGGTAGDQLGKHLFSCGDLTGDGLDDVIVTAPWFQTPSSNWSRGEVPDLASGVFVVPSERLTSGLVAKIYGLGFVYWGAEVGEQAGTEVLCDTDLDGGGRVDIIIGSPLADDLNGRLYILRGEDLPASGSLGDRSELVFGPTESWLGSSLAILEKEGRTDIAVGLPGLNGGQGRVWILDSTTLGRAELAPRIVLLPEAGRTAPDHLGRSLVSGDLNGDGLSDLVVGTPDRVVGSTGWDAGRAFVLYDATHLDRTFRMSDADVRIEGNEPFQRVGATMIIADADSDGKTELWLPTRAR